MKPKSTNPVTVNMFVQSGVQANKKCLLLKNKNIKEVRNLDPSVVTGSKKPLTKWNDWLIFIMVLYPYVLLCISANGLVSYRLF